MGNGAWQDLLIGKGKRKTHRLKTDLGKGWLKRPRVDWDFCFIFCFFLLLGIAGSWSITYEWSMFSFSCMIVFSVLLWGCLRVFAKFTLEIAAVDVFRHVSMFMSKKNMYIYLIRNAKNTEFQLDPSLNPSNYDNVARRPMQYHKT